MTETPPPRSKLFSAPLPRFILRDLPEEAWPLYLSMTGWGFGRLDRGVKLMRFHWTRLLALPFIFPAVYLGMMAGDDRMMALWFGCAGLMAIIAGGGMFIPQPFSPWMASAANQGLLEDLALSRLDGAAIVQCHYWARLPSIFSFWLALAVLFLSLTVSDRALGPWYYNEYVYFYVLSLFGMGILIINHSLSYIGAFDKGIRTIFWLWRLFYVAARWSIILLVIAALASWILMGTVFYLLLAILILN
jgi:hypothetical protein